MASLRAANRSAFKPSIIGVMPAAATICALRAQGAECPVLDCQHCWYYILPCFTLDKKTMNMQFVGNEKDTIAPDHVLVQPLSSILMRQKREHSTHTPQHTANNNINSLILFWILFFSCTCTYYVFVSFCAQ